MEITSFRLEPSCDQGCVGFPLIKHLLQLPGKGDQTGVHFLTVKITVGFHVKTVSQFIGPVSYTHLTLPTILRV